MEPELTPRKSARIGWRVTRTALALALALWLLSLGLVLLWQRLDARRPANAIVVLGAAQWDGKPSPVLRARVDHAISLWRKGLAPTLIMTGGQAPGDTTSEAAVERRYAIRRGVPDSAIRVETRSRTSRETLRNVAAMLDRGSRNVILVSDGFHMLRLSIVARRYGLRPQTSPTRTSPISANREEFWRYTLHESWKAPAAFFFEFYESR